MAQFINDIESHIIRTNMLQGGHENLIFTYDPADRELTPTVAIGMLADETMVHGWHTHGIYYPGTTPSFGHQAYLYGHALSEFFINSLVMSLNLDDNIPVWCPIATISDLPPIETHIVNYTYNIDIDASPEIQFHEQESSPDVNQH